MQGFINVFRDFYINVFLHTKIVILVYKCKIDPQIKKIRFTNVFFYTNKYFLF